jgi:UPF0716 protein FxsA
MPILLFISLFTLLDFVLLFSIGSQIGLLATLILVLSTGFIGLHLIRKEGVSTFARARQRMQMGEIPSQELLTGAALIFGGALLLAPGFLSDALGIACLIPNARQLLMKALTWVGLKSASHRHTYQRGAEDWERSNEQPSSHREEGPIEGEFISGDDEPRRR